MAPIGRTEEDFDPAAKFHIISNTPYVRLILSIHQLQSASESAILQAFSLKRIPSLPPHKKKAFDISINRIDCIVDNIIKIKISPGCYINSNVISWLEWQVFSKRLPASAISQRHVPQQRPRPEIRPAFAPMRPLRILQRRSTITVRPSIASLSITHQNHATARWWLRLFVFESLYESWVICPSVGASPPALEPLPTPLLTALSPPAPPPPISTPPPLKWVKTNDQRNDWVRISAGICGWNCPH